MDEPLKSRFGVTSAEILSYDWQPRLASQSCKECWSYYDVFAIGAKECQDIGDHTGRNVYLFLHVLASFRPNYDLKGNPYGPKWRESDGQRMLMAEDLLEDDLMALGGILEAIIDPEFKARVGDILWEYKRNYKAAQIAAKAFLESAERLKTVDCWPPYIERLERAAQIGASLGFGQPFHLGIVSVIEQAIHELEGNLKAGLLSHRLMQLALIHDGGKPEAYAISGERFAKDFARELKWDFSEAYWLLAAQCHRKLKNDVEARRCLIEAAECNVSKAEAGLDGRPGGIGFAALWMGKGVEALRQAQADSKRIAEAHRRFLELEKQSLSELNPLKLDLDCIPGFRDSEKEVQKAAVAHVKGKDFVDALGKFAHITTPTNTEVLRKRVTDISDGTIFDKIAGSAAVDYEGKIAASLPPSGIGPDGEKEENIMQKMLRQAVEIDWQIQVVWKIEPARFTIVSEHPIRLRDLHFLVINNPFIPLGHGGIYMRGLQAGFLGDWLIAMHLLIPQLEASIRHVLKQHGEITSTLVNGIQEDKDINQLLGMPKCETIFGADYVFDLRGMLIERFGRNLRNKFAHGQMHEGVFYEPFSVYLWWLTFRLCWTGYCFGQKLSSDDTQSNI